MTDCYECVGNYQRCPIECQFISVYNENKKKINKSVMLPSSQYLNIKKGMITSKHVGQSANPKKLLQTGHKFILLNKTNILYIFLSIFYII